MSERPLRIALVRQRYTPFGGAERFVGRALEALQAEGADISLITRSWQGGALPAGLRLIPCDPAWSRFFGGRAARDRRFAEAAAALMAAGNYDIVQAHERIPGASLFRAGDGVHAAWLDHRRPTRAPWASLVDRCSPYHRYVLAAEAALFAHPALKAVICNSRMVADEIHRYYGLPHDRLEVIYNGVDTDAYHPDLRQLHRQGVRRALGFSETEPLLLYVGSGFARKGVPQLLEALARCRNRSIGLIIVGADRHLKAMQRLAGQRGLAGRVRFTGGVEDVKPYYGAADAFVLPTHYDPCPNAALEALASGLPLITSTACGAREWVQEGQNGFVVGALEVSTLADRLADLADLARAPTAHQAARQAVEALTLPAMANRLLALYRRLQTAGQAPAAR